MSDLQNLPEILVLYTKDSLVPTSATLKFTWNVPMLSDTRVLSSYVSLVGVGGEKLDAYRVRHREPSSKLQSSE
jgi:hypothetical protein